MIMKSKEKETQSYMKVHSMKIQGKKIMVIRNDAHIRITTYTIVEHQRYGNANEMKSKDDERMMI